GEYPLQPALVDDVGRIVADQVESASCVTLDAAGRERFGFRDYVALVARAVRRRPRLIAAPPRVVLALPGLLGRVLGAVVLPRGERPGRRDGRLAARRPPTAGAPVRAWLPEQGARLGRRYTNDRADRRGTR